MKKSIVMGIAMGLTLVLGLTVAAWAVAGFTTMSQLRAQNRDFQLGYVAGVSDLNDAIIARLQESNLASRMLCLKRFTDTRKLGELANWLLQQQQADAVQAADAMLVGAACTNL